MELTPIPRDHQMKSHVQPSPAWVRDPSGVVWIRCQCGKLLGLQHEINADGEVRPSLHHNTPECGWHVFGRLLDWDGSN